MTVGCRWASEFYQERKMKQKELKEVQKHFRREAAKLRLWTCHGIAMMWLQGYGVAKTKDLSASRESHNLSHSTPQPPFPLGLCEFEIPNPTYVYRKGGRSIPGECYNAFDAIPFVEDSWSRLAVFLVPVLFTGGCDNNSNILHH
jgi:hypothetical protein